MDSCTIQGIGIARHIRNMVRYTSAKISSAFEERGEEMSMSFTRHSCMPVERYHRRIVLPSSSTYLRPNGCIPGPSTSTIISPPDDEGDTGSAVVHFAIPRRTMSRRRPQSRPRDPPWRIEKEDAARDSKGERGKQIEPSRCTSFAVGPNGANDGEVEEEDPQDAQTSSRL